MLAVGNPAKPTELKLLEGNRGHRPIPDDNPEPKSMEAFPDPPEWLDDIAREEWTERGRELFDMGVLTSVDLPAFEFYCYLYSKARQDPNNQNLQQLRMYMNEFGITPASRGKLHISKPKKDKSKFGRYLT